MRAGRRYGVCVARREKVPRQQRPATTGCGLLWAGMAELIINSKKLLTYLWN